MIRVYKDEANIKDLISTAELIRKEAGDVSNGVVLLFNGLLDALKQNKLKEAAKLARLVSSSKSNIVSIEKTKLLAKALYKRIQSYFFQSRKLHANAKSYTEAEIDNAFKRFQEQTNKINSIIDKYEKEARQAKTPYALNSLEQAAENEILGVKANVEPDLLYEVFKKYAMDTNGQNKEVDVLKTNVSRLKNIISRIRNKLIKSNAGVRELGLGAVESGKDTNAYKYSNDELEAAYSKYKIQSGIIKEIVKKELPRIKEAKSIKELNNVENEIMAKVNSVKTGLNADMMNEVLRKYGELSNDGSKKINGITNALNTMNNAITKRRQQLNKQGTNIFGESLF